MAKSVGFVPAIVIPEIVIGALPVLESVNGIGALTVPKFKLPKGTVAGESNAEGAVPIPVSVAFCGAVPPVTAT
jgi:hypothetical protein